MHKFLVIPLFLLLFAPAHSQFAIMRSDADSSVRKGIFHIYNMQFDSAQSQFQRVQTLYPAHPVGYFMETMVDWWKIYTNTKITSLDDDFLKKVEKTIAVCDKILEANPNDIAGLFFKGGAIGFRGRFYATRESWISAASDGKTALDIVTKSWEIAPGNKDVLLGVGIYHYFAEVFQQEYPIVKPLMIFLPTGDRKNGLLELELAAKSARYADTEAKVVLLQAYYQFEKDYYKAMNLVKELFERYPRNPVFHKYLGRCYVQNGYGDLMESTWREVLLRCMDRQTGYDNFLAREAMYYIAISLINKRQLDDALRYLYKCDEFSRNLDESPSGFMVQLNLKIGNIYDLQGKRELAIAQYNKILAWDDKQSSHDNARRYMQKPYGQ